MGMGMGEIVDSEQFAEQNDGAVHYPLLTVHYSLVQLLRICSRL